MSPRDMHDLNIIYQEGFWASYCDLWRSMGYLIPSVDDTESQQDINSVGAVEEGFEIWEDLDDYPGSGTFDDPIDLTLDD